MNSRSQAFVWSSASRCSNSAVISSGVGGTGLSVKAVELVMKSANVVALNFGNVFISKGAPTAEQLVAYIPIYCLDLLQVDKNYIE